MTAACHLFSQLKRRRLASEVATLFGWKMVHAALLKMIALTKVYSSQLLDALAASWLKQLQAMIGGL